jgi:hypothetical protein
VADVTFGVKVPEELKEQLQKLMGDSGLAGKDFMQQIINSYTLEKTKENIPAVAEDLKELQGLTQRINNIYLSLGYRIENITKAQLEQQQNELYKKDSLISDLQNKNNKSLNDYDVLTEAYNNIVNQNNEYLQRVNELTDSNINIKALIEEYKGKNDYLLGQMKQFEKYPEQLEEYKKLLSDAQLRNIDKENVIKDKDFNIKELNVEIETLKKDNIKALEQLEKENSFTSITLNKDIEKLKSDNINAIEESTSRHLSEIETLKKENELNIKLVAAEIKEELNNKLNQDQAKHNLEIAEYQSKYKQLLEELEQSKKVAVKTKEPKAAK